LFSKNWSQANSSCKESGMALAEISNVQEQDFLLSKYNRGEFDDRKLDQMYNKHFKLKFADFPSFSFLDWRKRRSVTSAIHLGNHQKRHEQHPPLAFV